MLVHMRALGRCPRADEQRVNVNRYVLLLQPSDADCWVALSHLHLDVPCSPSQCTQSAPQLVPSATADLVPPPSSLGGEEHVQGSGGDDDTERRVAVSMAMLDTALQMQPAHSGALLARGNLEREACRDFVASRRWLMQALRSLDTCPLGKTGLEAREKSSEAEWRRRRSQVKISLGMTAEALERDEEAEHWYREALRECSPGGGCVDSGAAAQLLAGILCRCGKTAEATEILYTATQACDVRSAADGSLFYNLALLVLQDGGADAADSARDILAEAHRLHPNDSDVGAKLGWLRFVTEQDDDGAEALLRDVLRTDPGHPAAVVSLARLAEELDHDPAVHVLPVVRAAVARRPDEPVLLQELARALLAQRHPGASSADDARRQEGGTAEARACLNREKEAESALRHALALAPADAAIHTQLARALVERTGTVVERHGVQGRVRSGMMNGEEPSADDVTGASAGRNAGGGGESAVGVSQGSTWRSGCGDIREEAQELLEAALRLDPACAEAYIQRGHLLSGAYGQAADDARGVEAAYSDLEGAIESYRHALGLVPGDLEAVTGLGEMLFACGHVAQGVREWVRALAMVPNSADLRYNFACLLAAASDGGDGGGGGDVSRGMKEAGGGEQRVGPGRADETGQGEAWLLLAKEEWMKAVELDPAHLQARYNLAMLLMKHSQSGGQVAQAGGEDAAVEHLRQVCSQDPSHAPSLYHLAGILEKRGLQEEAVALLQALLANTAEGVGYADAAARLGLLLAGQGQVDDAEAVFQKAVEAARAGAAASSSELAVRAYAANTLVCYATFLERTRGHADAAVPLLREALELVPDLDVTSYLGFVLVTSAATPGVDAFGEGMRTLEQVLREDPTHVASLCRYARALLREADDPGPSSLGYDVRDMHGRSAIMDLGHVCRSPREMAREFVARALRLDPACAAALDLLDSLGGDLGEGSDPLAGLGEQVGRGVSIVDDRGGGCGGWGDAARDDEDLELGQFGGGERVTAAAETDSRDLSRSGRAEPAAAPAVTVTSIDTRKGRRKMARNWDSEEETSLDRTGEGLVS